MAEVLPNTVYISGCSHSHYWYLDNNLANSWTANLDFQTVYNHGLCGSSNDFSARRAWMFCEKYRPELAIVQWTNLTRTETIGADAPTDQVECYANVLANPKENTSNNKIYHLVPEKSFNDKPWEETQQSPFFYKSTFYGPWNDDANTKAFIQTYDFTTYFCNLIKNAYLLQNYFKAIGQNYVFVNGTDWFHTSDLKLPDDYGHWYALDFLDMVAEGPIKTIKPLADQIDRTRWLRSNIMETQSDKGSDDSHPGIKSHKKFANNILSELEKLNVSDRK